MNMKKLLVILSFFTCVLSQAQYIENTPWMKNIDVKSRAASSNPVTFQEVVDAFNNYWKSNNANVKGSGYKPFKRWETYWENFVKEDGTLPTQKELWQSYLSTKNISSQKNFLTDLSDWQPVGPFSHTNTGSWSSGQGRVNIIVKDTALANTYYAGAPAGGFWKSIDNGTTWETSTDFLPQIGVSGIAIDYNNPGTIYIATGDDDGGDSYSIGVLKSIDGGETWNTTGLNATNSPNSMNEIYIHPTNSNILWVATSSGVYKSLDAGATWSNANGTQNLNIKDLKVKPNDPSVVYAVSSNRFFKSSNGGDVFGAILTNTQGFPLSDISRLVIDVTPANPNVVYVLAATGSYTFKGVYKSSDSGNNFTTVASPATVGDIFESTQTWFDMALAISDTNENEIYTGVLNIWKGLVNNNQASFTKINNWSSPFSSTYTHADIHYLRYFNGELLVGSDGGFYKSTNNAVSFTDLTAGMQISQFYRISVSKNSSNKMVGGLQDNGGHAFSNNQWYNYYGADGMDTAIDPNNSNLYYGFIQNGSGLYISNSAGATASSSVAGPESGNWITPLTMNSDSELFAGYSALYKLENGAFNQISQTFTNNINVVEIDKINPDLIYIVTNNGTNQGTLRKSTDRGVTFNTMQVFNSAITSVEINEANSDIVYVTTSGLSGQVLKSIDAGVTFTNISSGLPNVTKNSIKHQNLHSKNPLYLGTSLGVYRYDDDTLTWELFNIGLPNVTVRDIEINVIDNKITAATYGRGIWQSPIPVELAPTDVKLLSVSGISDAIDCNSTISPQVTIANNGLSTITSVDVTYTVDGVDSVYTWTGTLNTESSTIINIPSINLTKGTHTFKSTVTTTNDAYDVNNDSEQKTIYTNGLGTVNVTNTFTTESENLLVQDEASATQYWQRGIPNGLLLNDSANPSNQVYATNLNGEYANNVKSYLISECYDLSQLENPELKFDMAFDLETDWDIVYMEYSTNQGLNWNILGSATNTNWYNSDTLPSTNCYNCPGAQWTGQNTTLSQYSYDLAAFASEQNIMFRFVFHSDQAVTQEGVIIDNFLITGSVLSVDTFKASTFSVYPNPSKGVFKINTNTANVFNFNIFDVTGKLILQKQNVKPVNKEYEINLEGYATGVYFLHLKSGSNTVVKKLILK